MQNAESAKLIVSLQRDITPIEFTWNAIGLRNRHLYFNQYSVNIILMERIENLLDLYSHDFMNFAKPISDSKKIAQIKNQLNLLGEQD